MSQRNYLVVELHGLETARTRGCVSTIQYDDDLAIDWYGVCRDEGLPFVQCAFKRKYHQVDYDLDPFLDPRPDIVGLKLHVESMFREVLKAVCKASPNRQARYQVGGSSGVISGIPREEAHRLARHIAVMFRDMGNYERSTWSGTTS